MNQVTYSPKAQQDISDIWDYTAETWGVEQADRYVDGIDDASTLLANGKRQGREVDIRAGYLKYAVGKHFVFFRAVDTGIEVIRILHQSMDTDLHL